MECRRPAYPLICLAEDIDDVFGESGFTLERLQADVVQFTDLKHTSVVQVPADIMAILLSSPHLWSSCSDGFVLENRHTSLNFN